jgi:hypothetical protein
VLCTYRLPKAYALPPGLLIGLSCLAGALPGLGAPPGAGPL